METGTFLLLVLAMGALSILLAVALVAAVVAVTGWLVRLLLAFMGPKEPGPAALTSHRRGWFKPMTECTAGVRLPFGFRASH